jgi:hypothetical protein
MPARLKNNSLTIQESGSAPVNPAASEVILYAGSNGKLYSKDDTGAETLLSSSISLAESDGATTVANPTTVRVPRGSLVDESSGVARLNLLAGPAYRNFLMFKAAAATFEGVGVINPTVAGTASASNDTDSTYVNINTGAVAGTLAGFITTFNLVRRQYNPILEMIVRTGADLAALRLWLGLTSVAITSVDTIAAGTSVAAFRYSTAAPDSGWVGVTNNGSTQSVTPVIASIAATTRYLLRLRIDSNAGIAYFSVNDGSEVSLNTNLPAPTTDLGVMMRVIPLVASGRDLKISRVVLSYD